MAAACSTLVDGVLSRAASLMGDFGPILYLVGGIALAMWLIHFLRGVMSGGE